MSDTVIEFPKEPSSRHTPVLQDTGFRLPGTQSGPAPTARKRAEVRRQSGQAVAPIEIDHLYPAADAARSDVLRALQLLADAISVLDQGRAAARNNDPIAADRFVLRFQLMLPGLFTCRKLGDGFAVIVNSLHFAFINQHGNPLTLDQLTTVWRIVRELRTRPFLSFDQALEYVTEIESHQLHIDPTILSDLLADPSDE